MICIFRSNANEAVRVHNRIIWYRWCRWPYVTASHVVAISMKIVRTLFVWLCVVAIVIIASTERLRELFIDCAPSRDTNSTLVLFITIVFDILFGTVTRIFWRFGRHKILGDFVEILRLRENKFFRIICKKRMLIWILLQSMIAMWQQMWKAINPVRCESIG